MYCFRISDDLLGLRSERSSENAYSILCLMCSNDFYSGLTLNQYGVASP
ncbi:hypothetical protein [Neisseria sicca]|nr:hypothetical protein [Neisseria sicca]QMT36891.1 hypothetical protein H3L95_11155 [Neisseria sicca]